MNNKKITVIIIAIAFCFVGSTVKALNADVLWVQINIIKAKIARLQEQQKELALETMVKPKSVGDISSILQENFGNAGEEKPKIVETAEKDLIPTMIQAVPINKQEVGKAAYIADNLLSSFTFFLTKDTPSTQSVVSGSKEVPFVKIGYNPDNASSRIIDSLEVCFFVAKKDNIKPADNLAVFNIRIVNEEMLVGFKQRIEKNGCAEFSSLGWNISSSTSNTFTIKGDIAKSMTVNPLFAKIGDISGNIITSIPSDYLGVSVSPDTPKLINTQAGKRNISIFKFLINNPTEEAVSISRLSLEIEGDIKPNEIGAITWKAGDVLIGESLLSSTKENANFTSIFNLSGRELFKVFSKTNTVIEVLIDIANDAGIGKIFNPSILEDFYISTIEEKKIAGFPIRGNNITITGEGDCIDTDNGLNEFVFGKIIKDDTINHDVCVFKGTLKEWTCTQSGDKVYKLVDCANGCVDGVCLKKEGNDETTNINCIDSDNGKDFYNYGNVKHGQGDLVDYDVCESGKILKEYYCNNGYFDYELYDCPKGCKSGGCIVQIASSNEGIENMESKLASISETINSLLENFKSLFLE